jgi:ABC-type Fe3+ transport system substrate-binding protein
MSRKTGKILGACSLVASLLSFSSDALPASLPQSTQEMFKSLKLNPAILYDIDQELRVPPQWMEGAKREGKVRMRGTPADPKELRGLFAPFKERYPFVEIEYFGSNQEDRSIKTLAAYRSGKVLSDLLESVAGFFDEYRKAQALEDLRDVPGWNHLPQQAKAADGLWVGRYTLYWCMSYNTRLVKKEDLPKKWEDLLANPRWRGGNLALGNRPQLALVNVWKARGEQWSRNFFTRLFTEVKPQLRKEGMNALPQLVAAGEFHAAIPTSYRRAYEMSSSGAPVGFTCPEPVPGSFSDIVMLKGAPNANAAKMLLNWLLSKEGQIAYYYASLYAPAHKDLRSEEFLPFADQILGRETSFWYKGEGEGERLIEAKLSQLWGQLWLESAGKSR